MSTIHMVESVQRYIDALSSHDIVTIGELFDEQASLEDPVGSEPLVGSDAIREWYMNGFSMNIKAQLTGNVRCAGNSAAFPFFVTLGSGSSVTKLESIDVFEFGEDGKIRTMKAYWGPENCSSV